MNENEYWEIVNKAYSPCGATLKSNLQAVLGELSEEEFEDLLVIQHGLRIKAYNTKTLAFATLVFSGCGDSRFQNFAGWTTLQSKEIFQLLISNPDDTVEILQNSTFVGCETTSQAPLGVAQHLYGFSVGMKGPYPQIRLTGEPIDVANFELLKTLFPKAGEVFVKTPLRSSDKKWPYSTIAG